MSPEPFAIGCMVWLRYGVEGVRSTNEVECRRSSHLSAARL